MAGEQRESRLRAAVAIGFVVFVSICAWLWITHHHDGRDQVGAASGHDGAIVSVDAAVLDPGGAVNGPVRRDASAGDVPTSVVDHTVRDRATHDEVRARILAAWSTARSATADAGARGAASDEGPPGGHLDASYIRSLIRDEFVPMARDCYDQQLARADASAGRMTLQFVIMADERAGGIVDDVQSDEADGGSFDDAFRTCMRETMRTMAFRAPEGGGRITVRYPFVFAAGDGG